jgi:drug/metabolite transporter (DMT)-like permease
VRQPARPDAAWHVPLRGEGEASASLNRGELRAAGLMLAASTLFGVSNTLVPVLAPFVSPVQIVVLSNLFAIPLAAPWLGKGWLAPPRSPRLLVAMMLVSGVSNLVWFEALARANVSLATALSFAAPLVAMPIAATVLGERVTPARWAAVAWGFMGTLVVLRPWRAEVGPGVWLAVLATIGFVGVYLTLRLLAGQETPARTVVAMSVGQVLSGLPLLPAVWRTPGPETLGGILLLAACMQIGRAAMQRAFSLGRASVVMPMDFLRLPAIAAIAWAWLGQVPDLWTFAGAAMIVSATVLLARL